jgi:hypothetical protein
MKLRRATPMEDAVWLLEYVGKTKGADHLKLASRYVQYTYRHGFSSRQYRVRTSSLVFKSLQQKT